VQELEELMHRKRRYKHQDLRHEVLMGLLIYQALLPQELAGLQTDDIDLMNGTVYVRGSAKTNSRKLALKPKQVMLLHGYLTDTRVRLLGAGTTTCLLISSQGRSMTAVAIAQEVLRRHRDAKGVKRVNARTIRQSVIANLLKQGHDISVVQLFAGHKLPDATQRYQSDKVESLRAALHKYHPFNHDQGAADNLKGGG
jgi:integrase/recombinase XerD